VRLDLDEGTLLKVHVSEDNLRAFFDAKVVHHPNRDMAHALLSGEFENTAVGLDAHLGVRDHEGHGVLDAKTSQFVKRRCWQDDYKHTIGQNIERVTRSRLLTFIASVEFWLADEGGTVNLITSQEDISRVGVASSDI